MATSHKTWEHTTQQALRKPRKKERVSEFKQFSWTGTIPLSCQAQGVNDGGCAVPLAARGWTSPPRVQGRGLLRLAWVGGCNCYSYNSKPSNNMELYLTVKDRKIIPAASISYQRSCLWEMVFSEPQISQLQERLATRRGRWWGGHRNSKCRAVFAYDLGRV